MKSGWQWRVLVLVLVLCWVSTPTWGQLTGAFTPTGFSGSSGASHTLSRAASFNLGISGVVFGENNDDPCFLEAKFKNVITGLSSPSSSLTECDDADGDGRESSHITLNLPAGSVLTGLRICKNGDKLKGIQLIGRYDGCLLGSDNVFAASTGCTAPIRSAEIFNVDYLLCAASGPLEIECTAVAAETPLLYNERKNCPGTDNGPDSDWETEINCPTGKIATGIEISTTPGTGTQKMIDGLALECTQIGVP